MAATTSKKKAPSPKKAAANPSERLLKPKPGEAIVRMYRIGHGDCFLLAFPGDKADKPVYVLIDCGYKPGSPAMIDRNDKADIKDVTASIREATGGEIDVAVITHEHQDHVNGISEKNFDGIAIKQAWFAWTEDPADELANRLRRQYGDRLLGLVEARRKLAAAADKETVSRIEDLLSFELGGVDEVFDGATIDRMLGARGSADPSKSANKVSMKVFKDKATEAGGGVKYLRPHEKILRLPGASNVRVFPMGPPRDLELLDTLDPKGGEEFHLAASSAGFFAAAASAADEEGAVSQSPFAPRYYVKPGRPAAAPMDKATAAFMAKYYGRKGDSELPAPPEEAASNCDWRRIDSDWLQSAEGLALAMSNQTNNASLVLAFELGKGGKVLLFVGDAQRGNWLSWSKKEWKDGSEKVTARDLLERTVLYKVGHHGSHNATLNGAGADKYPNLSWMAASSEAAREFTAMITAVRPWAMTQKGWDHPLKAIKDALVEKAGGRVFQTDTSIEKMKMRGHASSREWKAFEKRSAGNRLYFDYRVEFDS